jgi:hypothetical protein
MTVEIPSLLSKLTVGPTESTTPDTRFDLRINFFTNQSRGRLELNPIVIEKSKTVISFKNGYALHRARMVESTRSEDGLYKKWSVDHTFSPILAKRPFLGHCELPPQNKTRFCFFNSNKAGKSMGHFREAS